MGSIFRGIKRKLCKLKKGTSLSLARQRKADNITFTPALVLTDSEEENERQFCKKYARMDTITYPEVSLKQQKAYLQYLCSMFGQISHISQRHSPKKGGDDEMYLAVKAIGVGQSPPHLQNLEDGNDEKNLFTRYYDFQGYEQFEQNIVDTHYIGSTPCKLDDLKRDKSNDNENNDEKNLAMYECEVELDGYEKFVLDIVGNHSTALEIGNTNTTEAVHCPTANGTTFYSQCEMGSLCAYGD